MTTSIEVPAGYVLIKKGGRPKNALRDIAVFLAYQMKKQELCKGYLAYEWLIEKFNLTDASHVRKCRKNARDILTNRFFAWDVNGKAFFAFPMELDGNGYMTILAETIGWGWVDGCSEAFELKMKSEASIFGPQVKDAGVNWQVQNEKNAAW